MEKVENNDVERIDFSESILKKPLNRILTIINYIWEMEKLHNKYDPHNSVSLSNLLYGNLLYIEMVKNEIYKQLYIVNPNINDYHNLISTDTKNKIKKEYDEIMALETETDDEISGEISLTTLDEFVDNYEFSNIKNVINELCEDKKEKKDDIEEKKLSELSDTFIKKYRFGLKY